MKILSPLLLSIAFVHAGIALDEAAAEPSASCCDLLEVSRNPFLPVGYTKPQPAPAVPEAPEVEPASLRVTSIYIGKPSVAVINGVDRTEGEWFQIETKAGQSVWVRLQRVSDREIVLSHPNEETITLRNPLGSLD